MTTKPTKKQLTDCLFDLMNAVEADYKCRGIDPRNVLRAHSWIALAMRNADELMEVI